MSKDIFKYENVEWSLPLLFQYEAIWSSIYKILKIYNIDHPKINMFGSPSNLWAGGRMPTIYGKFKESTLINLFKYLKELNAVPTFTFTSTQLTEEDLKDDYANFLLDIALEYDARFIVYSDILRDHIKSKKENACIVASVIKSNFRFQGPNRIEEPTVENETNYYNKLLKEYDIVVVRPEYSMTTLVEHPEYIDDISRIEVLINQLCIKNCPKMQEHYRFSEEFSRQTTRPDTSFECIKTNMRLKDGLRLNLAHSTETVKKLVQNGVNKLKLQGRGLGWTATEIEYLLYGQMFNVDGEYYHIQVSLAPEDFDKEQRYFVSLMQQY